jgi:thiamine pyrophosphokinase
MVALILADGDAPDRAFLDTAWPDWAASIRVVIAADGGARHATALGLDIDAWVGDGDSIDPAALAGLEVRGVDVRRAAPDKDESDTELAVRAGLERDADGIIILGATGGPRLDHELANLGLLAMPELGDGIAFLYTPRSRIGRLRQPGGPREARSLGRRGDTVSLLPFGGDVRGVTTRGLRYPLRDEDLPMGPPRGLSNVVDADDAAVTIRDGLLLVIETPATIRP